MILIKNRVTSSTFNVCFQWPCKRYEDKFLTGLKMHISNYSLPKFIRPKIFFKINQATPSSKTDWQPLVYSIQIVDKSPLKCMQTNYEMEEGNWISQDHYKYQGSPIFLKWKDSQKVKRLGCKSTRRNYRHKF